MQEYLLRRACDRCHTQKLRCEREGDVCARCSRAGVPCVWSPSLRKQPVRRSESRSPTEFQEPSAMGGKRRRVVAPTLSPSSYSSIQSHLINDQRSHHEFDPRDPRTRPGASPYDRPRQQQQHHHHQQQQQVPLPAPSQQQQQQPHQRHYGEFDQGLMAPPPYMTTSNPFDGLTDTQYWNQIPTDSSVGWTPTYVSSIESSSATSSTATDPSMYSAINVSQPPPSAMLPYQTGAMGAPTSAIRSSREGSMPRSASRPAPPQLVVDTSLLPQPVSIVQGLSTINVRLHENATRITKQRAPKSGTTKARDQRSRSASVVGYLETTVSSASLDEDLSIDETFQLSLDFIDTLSGQSFRQDAFSSPERRQRARSVSAVSSSPAMQSMGQNFELPPSIVDNASTNGPRFDDQASVLLVLSCYLRLINTFDDIFEHIQAVLENPLQQHQQQQQQQQQQPQQPQHQFESKQHNLRLKRISVGDFSPPKDSLAHANLVLQMSEHLLTCVRGKVKNAAACEDDQEGHIVPEGDKSSTHQGEGAGQDVTKMTLLAIKVREVNIVNKLKRIRASLHQPSIFL